MRLHPILSAMRRNKVGPLVIAVQMAVTLAILCNALFIIEQRIDLSRRPSGTDEASIFAIDNQWVSLPTDLPARVRADLAALRSLPGVEDAYVTNAYPLTNNGWSELLKLHPQDRDQKAVTALYFADEHTIETLGLKLIAGRNFDAADVADRGPTEVQVHTPVLIITRALAQALFPGGNALGQSVYIEDNDRSTPIVGIVDTLQIPWTSASRQWTEISGNSMLVPFRFAAQSSSYVVRTRPQRLAAVMQAARSKLMQVNHARVLQKVRPLTAWRAEAYRDDRGLAIILGMVCTALLAVTAFGIVGLTSYWVTQRRRQIGIRRALGATRTAIVRYFQTENLLIAAAAAALGIALALALNLWMIKSFEMARLHTGYLVTGAVAVLVLGQLAVLWPALRAASIPPALATRSA